jgi:hypothetical protein
VAVDGRRDDERGEPDQPDSLPSERTPSRAGFPRPRKRRGTGADGSGKAIHPARSGGREEAGELAERGEPIERGKRRGGFRAFFGVIADRVMDVAPRIPVREESTLRAQFPGLGTEEIADKLVAGAMRSSATVGAGVGVAAMLPVPPAMPAELAAEMVGVASVELKLIAELHELYGHRPDGDVKQRAGAYLRAWTSERGIDVTRPTTLNAALGGQMKRELRQRLLKRTARNLPNVAPFMVGATVGAVLNRRDTQHIAKKIRDDLRSKGRASRGRLRVVPQDEQPGRQLPPGSS